MSDTIVIANATPEDAEAILTLQRAAYQQEAVLYDDFSIPPLTETLQDMKSAFVSHVFLKATLGDIIVGSVRASCDAGTCHVGRLIVRPDFQGKGIGTRLLSAIENRFPEAVRFELFTGHKSHDNLDFYSKRGYRETDRHVASDRVTLVYMQKERRPNEEAEGGA